MRQHGIPHFTINNKFQKGGEYSDILSEDILKSVCERITGIGSITYDFIDEVNVGKLAILKYGDNIAYVMFPDIKIASRNSYFQSFPSALVRYHNEPNPNKNIYFYFLPSEGNNNTSYFKFMYRLMATAGVIFLNSDEYLPFEIHPFNTIEDIIAGRELNRNRNSSNKSTYLTKTTDNEIEIFGKTYGANKKETTLLCLALSNILDNPAKLYIICEQDLTNLPAPDLEVIKSLGKIFIIPTDLTMEKRELEDNNSLRSPRFIYNLLDKLGPKKCAFCECDIPQLIQGAHIWPVADIKKEHQMSLDEKLFHATSRDNGLWLCENHHKLFDEHLFSIDFNGSIKFSDAIAESSVEYLTNTTPISRVSEEILNEEFKFYIYKRNKNI